MSGAFNRPNTLGLSAALPFEQGVDPSGFTFMKQPLQSAAIPAVVRRQAACPNPGFDRFVHPPVVREAFATQS